MTEEYKIELTRMREATRAYDAVGVAYRAGKVSDDEFLAALAVYKEAEIAFDEAFAKEQETGE